MRLLHYTYGPLDEIRSVSQVIVDGVWHAKPAGLWVSIGEAWLEWCQENEFGCPADQRCYEIALVNDAGILHVETPDELLEFAHRFSFDPLEGLPGSTSGRFGIGMGVRWDLVAAEYSGIIIAPYQWEHRLDPSVNWYYGWDCASGCIWSAAAVASVKLVRDRCAAVSCGR